jgi:hypothetical protein
MDNNGPPAWSFLVFEAILILAVFGLVMVLAGGLR